MKISPPHLPYPPIVAIVFTPGHINQTVRERGGGLKEEEGGRDGGSEVEEEKKRNGSYGHTLLFKVVTVIGLV